VAIYDDDISYSFGLLKTTLTNAELKYQTAGTNFQVQRLAQNDEVAYWMTVGSTIAYYGGGVTNSMAQLTVIRIGD